MGKPSKAVLAFMEKYKVDSDEIWEVHGTTWVVKHKALERVAAEVGIIWEKPELKVCDMAQGFVAVLIAGRLGERVEYSFGEASPKNNKNSYPIAMAEKRSKDRVILKLLAAHGDIYSEEEADDFKRQNPHVNRATDFHDEFTDDIPTSEMTKIFQPKMKVKDSRSLYPHLLKEMQRIQDVSELKEWGAAKADEINALSGDWPQHFRGEYAKHKQSITNGRAA
jgi:hypothetical protein